MTEPSGPGWWQASDGAWYPPDQHPDPAHRARYAGAAAPEVAPAFLPSPSPPTPLFPPTPPTPPAAPTTVVPVASAPAARVLTPRPQARSRLRQVGTGVLAALAVLGVGVASFLVAGGNDGDEVATTTAIAGEGEGGTADTAEDDPTTSTEPTTSGTVEASVDVGPTSLTFDLPAGWVDNIPGSGVSGSDLFDDDPDLAAVFDANLDVAIEQGAVLFAMHTDLTKQALLRVAYVELGEGTVAGAVDGGRVSIEAAPDLTISEDGPIALADGNGHVFRYADGGAVAIETAQVIIPSDGAIFVLLAQSADPAVLDQVLDLAITFTIS